MHTAPRRVVRGYKHAHFGVGADLRQMIRRTLIAVTLTAAIGGAPASASAKPPGTPVPPDFVGMNADGPLLVPPVDLNGQLGAMVKSGVASIRTAFYWSAA